jgi:metal-responsive CopG/Arc/MetJ family transcriptional regulator
MTRERTERLQVQLGEDELRAVEEFRFRHRLPSRAAAVRELLKRGLHSSDSSESSHR